MLVGRTCRRNDPRVWKVEITRDPAISSCDREGYYASFVSL